MTPHEIRPRSLLTRSDQTDRKQQFGEYSLCDHADSEIHYHIRWHPTGQLDWECFSSVEAAEARVREIRLKGETSTIEPCLRPPRLRSGLRVSPIKRPKSR
jgi:hypothetical protein